MRTNKEWHKIINENIPKKYKYFSKYVGLYNNEDMTDWNGFDFEIKDLSTFYDNQKYLKVFILKPGQIIDTISIRLY